MVGGLFIVKWEQTEASARHGRYSLNLGRLNMTLWWQGYSGLTLMQIINKLEYPSRFGSHPAILLHCGGNYLGSTDIRKLSLETGKNLGTGA